LSTNPIRNHHLFRGASAEELDAIAALAQPKELIGGDTLFLSGSRAEDLFLIESGSVEVTAPGKDLRLATLGAGQAVGELPFFHGDVRDVAARALEATRLLCLPYAGLTALLEQRPQLARLVYRNAAAFYARLVARVAAELDHPYF
jgi:CRP-like cAMP-binding protein